MAPRWMHLSEEGRRYSTFISRPEVSDELEKLGMGSSSPSQTEIPALHKRLSMYARVRASSVTWAAPGDAGEFITPRSFSEASGRSVLSSSAAEQSDFRSSLRRTSRLVTRPSLSSLWVRGPEKSPGNDMTPTQSRRLSMLSISTPFNFEHVSHTSAHKLPKMKSAVSGSFLNDFLEASQAATQSPDEDANGAKPQVVDTSLSTEAELDTSRARSSSLASVMSNHTRPAPTLVHPALRTDGDNANADLASQAWLAPFIHRTSISPSIQNLAVVPEEQEPESPANPPQEVAAATSNQTSTEVSATCPNASARSLARISAGSSTSDGGDSRTRKSSVPSLCSVDSWEDDIDYCYSVKAESSCNFEWSSARVSGASPRDSLNLGTCARQFAIGTEGFNEKPNESPRTSIARQQVMKKTRPSSNGMGESWFLDEAYQRPRKAPGTPTSSPWTSDQWPLSISTANSPALMTSNSVNSMSPLMPSSYTHELRKPHPQIWPNPITTRWHSMSPQSVAVGSAPASPASSPVPPPSTALPRTPHQRTTSLSLAAESAWI